MKEKNINDFNGPLLEEESTLRNKKGRHSKSGCQ